jgi:colanic acid biosynthesis glycosyl transferase WcaI
LHILLLTQYFPPETGSAAAKMAEMAQYLSEGGHRVSVVSQIPNYPSGIVYPGYEGAWFRRESQNGVGITRAWSYASPERDRFRPRFFNYATFMGTALAGILSGSRPDIILVYSPPLFLGLTATLAEKTWGCPFIFWVNDLWPRAAIHLGFMQDNALYRLACGLERFIYRQAARIFVYSRHMLEEVVVEGADRGKIECHPLWIDTQVFHPEPAGAARIRAQYGWGEKFVALYGGNLGLAQGLDVLMESARLLRDNPDIHFVLVGSGVEKEKLVGLAKQYRLANVEFIGQQPKEEVCTFFSAADLLFAHLKEAPHRVGTVPEKILAYMACGRPVLIAAQEGAAAEMIREHGCGLAVAPDSPEMVAQAILSLHGDRSRIEPMGIRGRQATLEYYDAYKVLPAMEATLIGLAESARARRC